MSSKEQKERRLLYRYDRFDDGSLRLSRPNTYGKRDESDVVKHDCLALEFDLSVLPEEKRKEYLEFEKAYVNFYRLWTGSGFLPAGLSRALDLIQRDMEKLRAFMSDLLKSDLDLSADVKPEDV